MSVFCLFIWAWELETVNYWGSERWPLSPSPDIPAAVRLGEQNKLNLLSKTGFKVQTMLVQSSKLLSCLTTHWISAGMPTKASTYWAYLGALSSQPSKDSRSEKPARGALFTAMQRHMGQDTLLIVDGMNYIKGFRYQMYCAARELKLRVCTVSYLNAFGCTSL